MIVERNRKISELEEKWQEGRHMILKLDQKISHLTARMAKVECDLCRLAAQMKQRRVQVGQFVYRNLLFAHVLRNQLFSHM